MNKIMDLNKIVEGVLKNDERVISTDGILLKNKIQELAYKLDPDMIGLLLSDDTLKDKFFIKVKDVIVFDHKKFVQFINNKEFLPDSYTAFKNKIGLADGSDEFLVDRKEVVLNRPYKDCVLAGGQDKEDVKRDEIFYNEILGSDDIDRLLDPKVFTNFKRIDKDGEHELDSFNRDEETNKSRGLPKDTITDNLLIKGNNLLALHSLKKQFAGKVKLIYIDPPYNTGNDGFKYNDRFNHSTWLTFMKNRLEVARELLKDDGAIFVQCDDNEQAYLKVLMDEVFGNENFICNMIRKVGVATRLDAKHISRETDYIISYSKKKEFLILNKESVHNMESYHYTDEYVKERGKYKLNKLDRGSISYTKKMDYIIKAPDGTNIYPGGVKENNGRCWRRSKDKFKWGMEKGFIEIKRGNKGWSVYFKQYQYVDNSLNNIKRENPYKNLLIDGYNNEVGNKEIKLLFGGSNKFSYPKSEILIKRLIEITSNKNDIVLDYYLGSGTTCAVAHKMDRQYVGIEQMDYIETISKERMKKVIEGEQGGISKSVNWKGGGDFVYMEIMKNSQKTIEEIKKVSKKTFLLDIYNKIQKSGFINYKLDVRSFEENIEEFEKLSLENMKKFIIELVDQNSLYVNYSEIKDNINLVSNEDKKLSDFFYKKI